MTESTTYSYDDDAGAIEDFFERGFTDGLPVIPPTPERVAAMLGGFAPDLLLGEVPTRNVEVTAEKTAINAVMAGCLPEYFPTVVATVRAFLQPKANAHSTTATLAGAAHAVIVNGPVRREIDVECGQACFGPGFRANATIGRALRLVIRNVCRTVPGVLDRATWSWPLRYSFCFGEDEERSDWTPLHVQLGYERDESVVTVQSVMNMVPVLEFGAESTAILDTFWQVARTQGLGRDEWAGDDRGIVFVVGLEHQRRFLDDGWTKEKIAEHLYPMLTAETTGRFERNLSLASPANILIVAAGGPGIAQSWLLLPAPGRTDARTRRERVSQPVLSAAAQATLDELAAIVEPDGARLVVRDASASTVTIELDLSASDCPECVLPKDLLVDILASRLQESDPDLREVELDRPTRSGRRFGQHPRLSSPLALGLARLKGGGTPSEGDAPWPTRRSSR